MTATDLRTPNKHIRKKQKRRTNKSKKDDQIVQNLFIYNTCISVDYLILQDIIL